MADVKIIEDFENQIIRIITPKANKELTVRKAVGPSVFFEIVWPNEKKPKGLDSLYTSQSVALKAALQFLNHMKPTKTVNRDNHTKAREARKPAAKQTNKEVTVDATESNS